MEIQSYRNFSEIVTLEEAYIKDGRKLSPKDLGIIKNGSIVFSSDKILWVGKESEFPSQYEKSNTKDFNGKILLPTIVDCHTHLVFGGERSLEYSMRLNGADYQEIAKAGGGILNSMKGTNSLSKKELFDIAVERINTINSYGVGAIEIKSGYGLNYDKEYELSHIIFDLKKHFEGRVQLINTYLAAHALPKQYESTSQYMNQVVIPLMKVLAKEKIIDAVDIFHEKNYFTQEDTELLFKEAQELNIPRKSHADEFFDNKGAILAAKYNALSTDHLLMTGDDGISALANSNTVATLLPGTGFFLGKKQSEARKFLDAGVKVAIASDYNPGSCHCDNVILVAALAAPTLKMNIAELWASITLNAAHALGLRNQGALVEGLLPKFSIFNTDTLNKVTYNWGKNFAISEHEIKDA